MFWYDVYAALFHATSALLLWGALAASRVALFVSRVAGAVNRIGWRFLRGADVMARWHRAAVTAKRQEEAERRGVE